MPILFTAEIISATKQMSAGWTFLEFKEFKKKPHKGSPGVLDYVFAFECIAGPGNTEENKGRAFAVVVYGNALSSGVTEAANTLVGLTIALLKCTADELIGKEVEYEKMAGTKIWCEIKDEPYEGRILKKANCFAPDDVVPF